MQIKFMIRFIYLIISPLPKNRFYLSGKNCEYLESQIEDQINQLINFKIRRNSLIYSNFKITCG